MEETRMAERKSDSARKTGDAKATLGARYHDIGISAVAAAMHFTHLPDAKEPAHDPGPSHPHHDAADKAA
jgi:hypothetical protein